MSPEYPRLSNSAACFWHTQRAIRRLITCSSWQYELLEDSCAAGDRDSGPPLGPYTRTVGGRLTASRGIRCVPRAAEVGR